MAFQRIINCDETGLLDLFAEQDWRAGSPEAAVQRFIKQVAARQKQNFAYLAIADMRFSYRQESGPLLAGGTDEAPVMFARRQGGGDGPVLLHPDGHYSDFTMKEDYRLLRQGKLLPGQTLALDLVRLQQIRATMARQVPAARSVLLMQVALQALNGAKAELPDARLSLDIFFHFTGGYRRALAVSLHEQTHELELPSAHSAPVCLAEFDVTCPAGDGEPDWPALETVLETRPLGVALTYDHAAIGMAAVPDIDKLVKALLPHLQINRLAGAEGQSEGQLAGLKQKPLDLIRLARSAAVGTAGMEAWFDGLGDGLFDGNNGAAGGAVRYGLFVHHGLVNEVRAARWRTIIEKLPANGLTLALRLFWLQPEGRVGQAEAEASRIILTPRPVNRVQIDFEDANGQRAAASPLIDLDPEFPLSDSFQSENGELLLDIPLVQTIVPEDQHWHPAALFVNLNNHRPGTMVVYIETVQDTRPVTLQWVERGMAGGQRPQQSVQSDLDARFNMLAARIGQESQARPRPQTITAGQEGRIRIDFDDEFRELTDTLDQVTYRFSARLYLYGQGEAVREAERDADEGEGQHRQGFVIRFNLHLKRSFEGDILGIDVGSSLIAMARRAPGQAGPELLPLTHLAGKLPDPQQPRSGYSGRQDRFMPAKISLGLAAGFSSDKAVGWREANYPIADVQYSPFGPESRQLRERLHAAFRRYALFVPDRRRELEDNAKLPRRLPGMRLKALMLGRRQRITDKTLVPESVFDARHQWAKSESIDLADLMADFFEEIRAFILSEAHAMSERKHGAGSALARRARLAMPVPSSMDEARKQLISRAVANMLKRSERGALNNLDSSLISDDDAELLGWRTDPDLVQATDFVPEGIAAAVYAVSELAKEPGTAAGQIPTFRLLAIDCGRAWYDVAVVEVGDPDGAGVPRVMKCIMHDSVRLGGRNIDWALAQDAMRHAVRLAAQTQGVTVPGLTELAEPLLASAHPPADEAMSKPVAWFMMEVEQAKIRLEQEGGRLLTLPLSPLPAGVQPGQPEIVAEDQTAQGDAIRLLRRSYPGPDAAPGGQNTDNQSQMQYLIEIPVTRLREPGGLLLPVLAMMVRGLPTLALENADSLEKAGGQQAGFFWTLSGGCQLFTPLASMTEQALKKMGGARLPVPEADSRQQKDYRKRAERMKAAAVLGAVQASAQNMGMPDAWWQQPETPLTPLRMDYLETLKNHIGFFSEYNMALPSQEIEALYNNFLYRFQQVAQSV